MYGTTSLFYLFLNRKSKVIAIIFDFFVINRRFVELKGFLGFFNEEIELYD